MIGKISETTVYVHFKPLQFKIFSVLLCMKELILDYLDATFYISSVDNAVFKIDGDSKIGFTQIETNLIRTFQLDEDLAHIITFNWLLVGGIKLVRKNWNKTYITHNSGVYSTHTTTLTSDIDFEYKLVENE